MKKLTRRLITLANKYATASSLLEAHPEAWSKRMTFRGKDGESADKNTAYQGCIWGIAFIFDPEHQGQEFVGKVVKTLRGQDSRLVNDVVSWNDSPDRKVEDVIAVLKEAGL